jgi:hypothetical protein
MLDVIERSSSTSTHGDPKGDPLAVWQMSRLRPFNRVYSHTTRYHPTEHDAKQPSSIFVVSYCIAKKNPLTYSKIPKVVEDFGKR